MGFEKVEYSFPGGDDEGQDIEIESSSAEPMQKPAKKQDESDFEIEIVDDTPAADRNRKPSEPPEEVTDDELENYSEKVRKRIQHFSKGYHDERRAKEQAFRERQEMEAFARKLVEENKQLKGNVNKSQSAIVEQAKRAVTGEIEKAKQAYKDAYETGNADLLLDAQEKLTQARIRADKLNNFKLPSLQEEKSTVKTTSNFQNQAPVTAPAPKRPEPDQKAISWANENTWFGQDDEMTSFALGLHNKLVKSGVDPKSDTYYENVNSRMREVFPDRFGETKTDGGTSRRSSNVVAPATRSQSPKKVRLTQTQVAIAKKLGVPLDIYAKQVAEEIRKANNG
jgi:hypothetical protein